MDSCTPRLTFLFSSSPSRAAKVQCIITRWVVLLHHSQTKGVDICLWHFSAQFEGDGFFCFQANCLGEGSEGWLDDVLLNKQHNEIVRWEEAPYARKAHPHPDHFLPVLVVLGAAGEQSTAEKIYEEFSYGLALSCFESHPPQIRVTVS